MSNLLTTTSTTRPISANTGDMYFETDTGRLIIYGGSGWSQYSPASAESVDDSGEINIFYGTFDEILAVQDKQPGDLFFRKTEDYVTEITFTHVPGTSNPGTAANGSTIYFQIMDEDDVFSTGQVQPRLTANASGQPYYIDMDQANWGTPDWQGSQNILDNAISRALLPAGATGVVSGDNNEVMTFTSPTWMRVYASWDYYLNYPAAPDYENTEDAILVYTGLDENDNELYSMITNY